MVLGAELNAGDTAWVMAAAALVLFMTPGLAFFYGGMVRGKNVLGMLMQNVFCMGLVSVLWAFVAFSLAFGKDHGGVIGGFNLVGLKGLFSGTVPGFETLAIPALAFVAFQMMFAIITPALITGATADRMRFGGWVLFLALWSILVYAPVAHWVFAPSGWLYGTSPIWIGFLAGALCFLAISLKFRFGYDDSLDVVGVHLAGGIIGSLLLGLFADANVNPAGRDGLFFGGGLHLLREQFVAVFAVLAFSFVLSWIIAKVVDATVGLRCTPDEELEGLDLTQHAEAAYSFGELGSIGRI